MLWVLCVKKILFDIFCLLTIHLTVMLANTYEIWHLHFLLVCWFVSRITQNLLNRLPQNLEGGWGSAQNRTCSLLMWVQIIFISLSLTFSEVFFYISANLSRNIAWIFTKNLKWKHCSCSLHLFCRILHHSKLSLFGNINVITSFVEFKLDTCVKCVLCRHTHFPFDSSNVISASFSHKRNSLKTSEIWRSQEWGGQMDWQPKKHTVMQTMIKAPAFAIH